MLMHGRLINPICNKTEITSEFLLGFNKLAGQLPAKGGAPRDQDGANGEPVMTESRPEGVTGKITRSSAAHRMAPGMLADLSEVGRDLARSLFDPYRPELHYMRGPGPKWHAKHDRSSPRIMRLVRLRSNVT
jgi:hypothetical protein